jgi:transcriptional regulator with XRE-family HTH domain
MVPMARPSIPTNGEAIRRIRQLAGWNLTPFAAHVGVNANYLSKLELGRGNASPAMLKKIADALGVKVRDLVKVEATTAA